MKNGHKKYTHNDQKTVKWPFGHLKRNIKMIEFNYTGIEMVNTEMKLHAIGHNLKRLYNELNKTTKNQENT
ncbi:MULTISPECIES: transposase [unclassified Methanobrevibacter]|jgi:hypothetical protein|uniref:transposase n=1 Tax=unclassified Methanobrevibacter TaxID=2638681 RepID=UPI0039B91C2A